MRWQLAGKESDVNVVDIVLVGVFANGFPDYNCQSNPFADFANKGSLSTFAGLHSTAGKLPEERQDCSCGTLCKQVLPVIFNDGRDDFDDLFTHEGWIIRGEWEGRKDGRISPKIFEAW